MSVKPTQINSSKILFDRRKYFVCVGIFGVCSTYGIKHGPTGARHGNAD